MSSYVFLVQLLKMLRDVIDGCFKLSLFILKLGLSLGFKISEFAVHLVFKLLQ
jgi:hypothetical protein